MNLFFDESMDAPVAEHLRQLGHSVACVWDLSPSIADDVVLEMANERRAVLVTADKDFGALVYQMKRVHYGVILVRLAGLSMQRKCTLVESVLKEHGKEIIGAFTVINAGAIRIRPRPKSANGPGRG